MDENSNSCNALNVIRPERSQTWPDLDTQTWRNPDLGRAVLGSQKIHPMKLLASTMLSAAIEAVQFSASFVMSLFASF